MGVIQWEANTHDAGVTSPTVLWISSARLWRLELLSGSEESEGFADWRADGTGVLGQADKADGLGGGRTPSAGKMDGVSRKAGGGSEAALVTSLSCVQRCLRIKESLRLQTHWAPSRRLEEPVSCGK